MVSQSSTWPMVFASQAEGSNTNCYTDADCGAGSGEVCTFFEIISDETGKPDAKGVCTTVEDPTEGDIGALCGGDTGLSCKNGFCLPTFNDGSGMCTGLCASTDDCPKNVNTSGLVLDMACAPLCCTALHLRRTTSPTMFGFRCARASWMIQTTSQSVEITSHVPVRTRHVSVVRSRSVQRGPALLTTAATTSLTPKELHLLVTLVTSVT